MEPANTFKLPHEDKGILYPNFCQHYHIGFKNYLNLKMACFAQVYESWNDVEQFKKLFNGLGYHKMYETTDK